MSCALPEIQLWSWIDRQASELPEHLEVCSTCRERAKYLHHAVDELVSSKVLWEQEVPDRIGPYAIEGLLGAGGMGVVYAAHQIEPDRSIALKVLRKQALPAEVGTRIFAREVRSLARLQHPAVAQIFDAGITEDGAHYIAMELVQGMPITQFAREHELSLQERLELFIELCDAVHHAHSRGVIHRDLKPANILIAMGGSETDSKWKRRREFRPKILDFGLAKITDAEPGRGLSVMGSGRLLGTLPFMSPEQANGQKEQLDIRTDVYSLGVILYELVTGATPYDLNGKPLLEAVRVITEIQPKRPARIDRQLRGDLDAILLKALAKEPTGRYASAAALGEDLQRHLTDLPVNARPPGAWYTWSKYVRRHKAATALIGLAILFVLGLALQAGFHERELQRKRFDLDAREKEIEDSVHDLNLASGLLLDGLRMADPWHGDPGTTMADFSRQAADSIRNGPEFRNPEFVLLFLVPIGEIWSRAGHHSEAIELLTEAVAIADSLPEIEPDSQIVALARLGQSEYHQGDFAAARDHLRRAVELSAATHPDESHHGLTHKAAMAATLQELEEYEETRSLVDTILTSLESIPVRQDPEFADSLSLLGTVVFQQVAYRTTSVHEVEALRRPEEWFLLALQIRERQFGFRHVSVADSCVDLARVALRQGRKSAARDYLERALDIYAALDIRLHGKLVMALMLRAAHFQRNSRLRDAVLYLEEAHRLQLELNPNGHPREIYLSRKLARLYQELDRPEASLELLQDGLRASHRVFGVDSHQTARSQSALGHHFTTQCDWEPAIHHHRQARRIYSSLSKKPHSMHVQALERLAEALLAAGEAHDAEAILREAMALARSTWSHDHPVLARMRTQLVETLFVQFDPRRADEMAQELARIDRDRICDISTDHPRYLPVERMRSRLRFLRATPALAALGQGRAF